MGIKKIKIIEHREVEETQVLYECYVSDFDNIMPFKEKGNDLQICLPLRRMKMIE